MLHRVQSLGPTRGLEAAKMASWLLTGFELVAAERGLSPVLPPRKSDWAGGDELLLHNKLILSQRAACKGVPVLSVTTASGSR